MRSAASPSRFARSHVPQSASTAASAKAEPRSEQTGEGARSLPPRCASAGCNLARSERNVCSRCGGQTCDLHFFAPVNLCESCADAAEIAGCPGCDPGALGALCDSCEAAFLADQSVDDGPRRCPDCDRPNQFGELCPLCEAERGEAFDLADRCLDDLDEAPRLGGRRR